MLRGSLAEAWQAVLLAAIGVGLLVACWLLLRQGHDACVIDSTRARNGRPPISGRGVTTGR